MSILPEAKLDVLLAHHASLEAQLLGQLTAVPVDGDAFDLPVFCAQNGVANEDAVLRHFARVYGVCVNIPATHLQPGATPSRSSAVASAAAASVARKMPASRNFPVRAATS